MAGLTMSLSCPPSGYTISWASDIAAVYGGYLSINKNSTNVVYVTGTTSGSFTANSGDTITVYVNGATYTDVSVYALIYVDTIQEQSAGSTTTVTISHSFTVSGAHYISGVSYDAA